MQKYKQLSLENRHQIKALMDAGLSQAKIFQTIGVHKSTISRELSRNVANRGKPKSRRFTNLLKKQATQWLEQEKLSPGTHQRTVAGPGSRCIDPYENLITFHLFNKP